MIRTHEEVIDAAREARDGLFDSGLTDRQLQSLIDLVNAMQDLNTLYWDQVSP